MISSIYKAFIINCIPMTPSSPFLISFLNFIHKFHTLKTRLILSLQPFLSQPALLVSSFLVNASPNTVSPLPSRIPESSLTLFFTFSLTYLQVLSILSLWYFSSLLDLSFYQCSYHFLPILLQLPISLLLLLHYLIREYSFINE